MNNKTLIFIGRSGAGKGTQIKLLINKLEENTGKKVLYVEPGYRFREFIKGDSCSAKKSKEIAEKGGLQPTFLAIWAWSQVLIDSVDCDEHIIFDGTPRRVSEASVLESALSFYSKSKPIVIFVDVSRGWAIDRLHGRGREDDTKESIAERMNWFEQDTAEVVKYFQNNSTYQFVNINGEQSIEQVHADICKALAI